MKYDIYAYRDNKTSFMSPILEQNEASAIRGFSYSVNSANGLMNFSPADFGLYRIGEFDADKGIITPENIPVLVVDGLAVTGK